MTGRLPFFVYGTLLPGEHRHDAFLGGRMADAIAVTHPVARSDFRLGFALVTCCPT